MKLRLPNVPPGARFRLNASMRRPYVCSSAVIAPTTPARASAAMSPRASPARATARAHQKHVAPDSESATARPASHQLVANSAETRPSARNDAEELIDARRAAARGHARGSTAPAIVGDRVQDELLRHEEAIEVELLVRHRGDHDRDRADLEDDESGAFEGGRRGRRRVRADAVGLEHGGMYPGDARRGRACRNSSDRAARVVQVTLAHPPDEHSRERMPMTYAKMVGRVVLTVGTAASLQGCAALSNVRVAPLAQENSSAQRSMLSLFNPVPFQHRSASDGMWLRAPEDRNPRYRYLGW